MRIWNLNYTLLVQESLTSSVMGLIWCPDRKLCKVPILSVYRWGLLPSQNQRTEIRADQDAFGNTAKLQLNPSIKAGCKLSEYLKLFILFLSLSLWPVEMSELMCWGKVFWQSSKRPTVKAGWISKFQGENSKPALKHETLLFRGKVLGSTLILHISVPFVNW